MSSDAPAATSADDQPQGSEPVAETPAQPEAPKADSDSDDDDDDDDFQFVINDDDDEDEDADEEKPATQDPASTTAANGAAKPDATTTTPAKPPAGRNRTYSTNSAASGGVASAGRPSFKRKAREPPSEINASNYIQYAQKLNQPGVNRRRTAFEVDIDAQEDHPWRRPGARMEDFFNFGFNERTWKDYAAKQVAHRLQAINKSQIEVFNADTSGLNKPPNAQQAPNSHQQNMHQGARPLHPPQHHHQQPQHFGHQAQYGHRPPPPQFHHQQGGYPPRQYGNNNY